MLVHLGTRCIQDVDQQVRNDHLLQRRLECLHKSVGQPADEPHRVGDQHLAVSRKHQLAGGRIEGREELVLGEHMRAGQRVQQRRLPGVRVADDGHGGHRHALPPAPLHRTLADHFRQFGLEMGYAGADDTPVLLELGLALAAQGAAARAGGTGGSTPG